MMNGFEARGWTLDMMEVVNDIPKDVFTLDDVYQYESELSRKYPQNQTVRASMRRQLQVLRDQGFLEFIDRGVYRKL